MIQNALCWLNSMPISEAKRQYVFLRNINRDKKSSQFIAFLHGESFLLLKGKTYSFLDPRSQPGMMLLGVGGYDEYNLLFFCFLCGPGSCFFRCWDKLPYCECVLFPGSRLQPLLPVIHAGGMTIWCGDRRDIESNGYIHVFLSGSGSRLILDGGMTLFGRLEVTVKATSCVFIF